MSNKKRYFVTVFGILILCLFILATITAVSSVFFTVEFNLLPGESDSKKLTVVNPLDSPAYNISHTPVAGDGAEMVSIEPERIDEIEVDGEDNFTISVSIPKGQKRGNYTTYSYFFFPSEGFPPSMPERVNILITVAPKIVEVYGIDLGIDGEEDVMTKDVTINETASFELTVKNTGIGLDVMQIGEPEFEDGEGWDVKLYTLKEEVSEFPCVMILNAGEVDNLLLNVTGTMPGTNLSVEITGRSGANATKADSVRAITFITKKVEGAVNDSDTTEIGP